MTKGKAMTKEGYDTKTEQQESVEGILCRMCGNQAVCQMVATSKDVCPIPKLESFYKEKYLGGLEERIEKEINKIKDETEGNHLYKVGLCQVLSIIQEMKK